MLKIYTSQYRYPGTNRLDITIQKGDKIFAPTWDIVMGYKQGKINEEEYTKQYYNLMRVSYRNNKNKWEELLSKDKIVLICFCKAGDFCHRLLLADILVKFGGEYVGEI